MGANVPEIRFQNAPLRTQPGGGCCSHHRLVVAADAGVSAAGAYAAGQVFRGFV